MQEVKKVRGRPHVSVGLQGPSGLKPHPKGEGGATVVDIGTFNEFGTKHIPERSFIRTTMDENEKELRAITKKLFFKMASGKMTTEKALTILGLKIQALIKKKITDLDTPLNDPVTIARKGSSNPLIDTGLMRNSITFKLSLSGSTGLIEQTFKVGV